MSARTVRALWAVVPFALVVAVVAFALVGAPGIDHGLATAKVPTHAVLTRREWVDIAVGSLFVLVAVALAARLMVGRRASATEIRAGTTARTD
jgi:hypothetical protein